jgi:ubiquinone/menaquinone biosynthesis C-methylase UbiE
VATDPDKPAPFQHEQHSHSRQSAPANEGEHSHGHGSHHGHSHSHDHDHPHDHEHGHDHSHVPHDWHSEAYVDYWINRDVTRDEERRPRIREMIAQASLPREATIRVLDVGAGYGFVTEEVLRAFPNAHVTLQDFSELMLGHARQRLAAVAGRLSFVLCDLTDPTWTERVGGPFDLIVSAIAIHNLRQVETIAACYRGIAGLLKPDAAFLNYDIYQQFGGIETHIGMMQNAGMTRVSRAWSEERHAVIVGHGRRAPPS